MRRGQVRVARGGGREWAYEDTLYQLQTRTSRRRRRGSGENEDDGRSEGTKGGMSAAKTAKKTKKPASQPAKTEKAGDGLKVMAERRGLGGGSHRNG